MQYAVLLQQRPERAMGEIKRQNLFMEKCPVIVFGSYAKYGSFASPDADVDVLFLPSYQPREARIYSPIADKILGRRVDITALAFSEFEKLLRCGDPFASSVLLTGCPVEDSEGRYGVLTRGFRGNYQYADVLENAENRYRLRWLRLCIYGKAEKSAYLQACYQWAITLMQMFIIKDDYPIESLISISLLGNPRYVIHQFAVRFDNVDESFYLALMQSVKRPSIVDGIARPSIDKMIGDFVNSLESRFDEINLEMLLPGMLLQQDNSPAILNIYKEVAASIDAMNRGETNISLGYGSTSTEESFLSKLSKDEITAFDYLFSSVFIN